MITLEDAITVIDKNTCLSAHQASSRGIDIEAAKKESLAYKILAAHNKNQASATNLAISFDALCSHDITYVGIIQTARASGLCEFPIPYILTNCHNSLCAVGGTINEDDHRFGLSAAHKYGGCFVPANMAVIHQYVRESLVRCGGMILGSDSHTRYGALGVMGFGEGGGELVKQLLGKTYDIALPKVVLVWLKGTPNPGVGPQDIALALIAKVFESGFVKNAVLEFHGPGIHSLSAEYRCGIDVMTTETTCLSSIWETDEIVHSYYRAHDREDAYTKLELEKAAAFDKCITIDLSAIKPMIALPFHPSISYPIEEVISHANDYLGACDERAEKLFGDIGKTLAMRKKFHDGGIFVEQAVIAGCAGGSFENIAIAAQILDGACCMANTSLYPASHIVAYDLVAQGYAAKAMAAGAILKNAFCGPCFGAGDTPANGTLSIRHSTRNFPNREGSKPTSGQLAAGALMDARSIAATAANGGKITPATELDPKKLTLKTPHTPSMHLYDLHIYNGFGKAQKDTQLILGPNITDWPAMEKLPKHLVLELVSHILDPVTTTDELIPSGETSSLRSNPLKLAEFTLSRKDPAYVAKAKAYQAFEQKRVKNPKDPSILTYLTQCLALTEKSSTLTSAQDFGFGSTIFARKPGDGSAREQAASCQKVLGGWANIALDYATKRYRSNLINWGMIPFLISEEIGEQLHVGDTFLCLDIADFIAKGKTHFPVWHINKDKTKANLIELSIQELTDTERKTLLAGCLINYYRS